MKYLKDNRNKSPLELAMSRNSYDCTNVILTNIFRDTSIVRDIKPEEINKLVEFSPTNLFLFFQNAIEEKDSDLPNFAKIRDNKDLIFICHKS